jgi:rSAM/selenodomain-associated transferase 2
MTISSSPELSIIIPVINEAETLPALFAMLARQDRVDFETLLVDGGSVDGTLPLAGKLAAESPFECRIVRSEKGRGRQLNAGARAAGTRTLLFLHADSAFSDPLALRRALDALSSAIVRRGDDRIAGRFALRFDLPPGRRRLGYYLYESKARLDRPECTHGDQGFLLRRDFFEAIGPFDESISLLEDTRLAEKIRRMGEWILLPAEILTSARRFETEGLVERQLLNALIMNFAAIGWDDFFKEAAGIYRSQDHARKLRLLPYLDKIRELLRVLSRRERCRLWYRTGSYVRQNVWQLAFALDARRNFRRGLPPGEGGTKTLESFERWFPITDHPPGRFAAAILVWIWFHLTCLWRRFREERPAPPPHPLAPGEIE